MGTSRGASAFRNGFHQRRPRQRSLGFQHRTPVPRACPPGVCDGAAIGGDGPGAGAGAVADLLSARSDPRPPCRRQRTAGTSQQPTVSPASGPRASAPSPPYLPEEEFVQLPVGQPDHPSRPGAGGRSCGVSGPLPELLPPRWAPLQLGPPSARRLRRQLDPLTSPRPTAPCGGLFPRSLAGSQVKGGSGRGTAWSRASLLLSGELTDSAEPSQLFAQHPAEAIKAGASRGRSRMFQSVGRTAGGRRGAPRSPPRTARPHYPAREGPIKTATSCFRWSWVH